MSLDDLGYGWLTTKFQFATIAVLRQAKKWTLVIVKSADEAGGDLGVIGAGKAVVAAAVVEGELIVFQAH